MRNLRPTAGRINALRALEPYRHCALPSGLTTTRYRISSDLLALLERHSFIKRTPLTERARRTQGFVFVYTITDAGRSWLDKQQK